MRDRKFIYLIACFTLAMFLSAFSSVVISIHYSREAIRKAEQGQCDGLRADVDAYREVPPTTKPGIHQVQSKIDRMKALHCPKG